MDARGRGCGHVGRGRRDSRLRALVVAGSHSRLPCPSPATPPGTLPSGTLSPGTSSLGPLSLLLLGPRGRCGLTPFPLDWCPRGTTFCLPARPPSPSARLYPQEVHPTLLALPAARSPVWLRCLKAGACWRSTGGTHYSSFPQVALDAPGWGCL